MRWTIPLLVGLFALSAAPTASAMELQTMSLGRAVPAMRAETGSTPRRHAPRHRFTLLDESAGTAVRARPRGRVLGTLAGTTPLGTPTWLWAVAFSRNDGWAQVVLPWRPNGRTGWVRARGHRVVHTRTWVQADLSRRRVMLMHGSHVARSFPAAIGAPDSPTPIGRFSVTDPIPTGDPSGPYGWYAF